MNDICRLCLSVGPELVPNLFDNSEIMLKVSSCLQIDILKEDSLPNQICLICNEKLDQMLTYVKTVINNQNMLYHYLKLGNDCLENFYLSLKDVKEIKQENVELKEEQDKNMVGENIVAENNVDENIVAKLVVEENNFEVPIKAEFELYIEENNYYSSDDNIALISFKEKEQSNLKQKTTIKKNTKKLDHKNKPLKKRKIPIESKENDQCTRNILSKIEEFKCLVCLKIFYSRSTLIDHYRNAHRPVEHSSSAEINSVEVDDKIKYKCGKCDRLFSTKKGVKGHIKFKHQESRPYCCKLCGRTFKSVPAIILHLRAHSGVKLFCAYGCGYNSAYASGIRTHERKHRNEYKYKCEECGKGFEVKSWFEEHQNVHTGAKPFVCNECGLAYPFKRYLVTHQTTAHPKTATRPDDTPFVCTVCALPCLTKTALKAHLSEKHGIQHCSLCDVCGKSFPNSSSMGAHRKSHFGVKNHTCSTCHKLFKSRRHLRRHELTHGEPEKHKRHKCSECSARYVNRAALVQHKLRHSKHSKAKVPRKTK